MRLWRQEAHPSFLPSVPGSDGDIVRGPFLQASPSLVIDLCRRHVPVAEQLLHLPDVLAGFEEESGCRRPERMRSVDAALDGRPVRQLLLFEPELLLVSAGFDAYAGDPITQMSLEPEDFAVFGNWLRDVEIPTAAILEGGYSDELPHLIDVFLTAWNRS